MRKQLPHRFQKSPSSLTPKLNAPAAFLYGFLRTFYWADRADTASRLPFLHDGIGASAFFLHESEGICAKRGQHRSLLSYEGINNHPSVFPFLKQFCPLSTAGQGKNEKN